MRPEEDFWTPEPIFDGKRVFVLASGPSLTPEVCEVVRGEPAIVVNSSCRAAAWADVLFFTDSGWFEHIDNGRNLAVFADGVPRRRVVEEWPGLVVSMSRRAKLALPAKVKRVKGEMRPDFPRRGAPVIRQGRSSGQTAIALAIAMGAREVILLGFDMRLVDGREHHHDDYRGKPRDLTVYGSAFVPAFGANPNMPGWNQAALDAGVTVLNATPGSALMEFPMVELALVLAKAA
ncbi:MAG: hypothetical protein KIS96_03510 [Bauldia sp.]|nr:hypothetical protein [Bauldia sp.]